MKESIKLIKKGLKEINELDNKILLISLLSIFSNVCSVFINIFFSSYIIFLISNEPIKKVLINMLILSIVNSILLVIQKSVDQVLNSRKTILYNKERVKINKIFFTIEYQKLESQEFQSLKQKYIENMNRSGSSLYRLCCQFSNTIKGFLSITLAIIAIIYIINKNIMNINFTKNKLFLIVVFIAVLALSLIFVFFTMSKLNNKKFKLMNLCLHYDSIFSYYYKYVTDSKNGKDIRIFNEQNLIQKNAYDKLNNGLLLRNKIAKISGIIGAAIATIGGIACFFIYSFVGAFAIESKMSYGHIVFLLGCLMQIIQGILFLVEGTGKINITLKTLPYYFNITQFEKNDFNNKYFDIPCEINSIKFEDVSFYYQNSSKPAINHVSFCIKKNEHIAIVGKNGAGKTSIIKLLCGLYTNYEGEIYINDTNIKYFNPKHYKKLFSIVFQDFNLFPFKIAENIATNDTPDPLKISKIINTNLLNFLQNNDISIDNYIGKEINTNGITLSGGQEQSIAIGRSLYKNSQIIIMDEPTASLDPIAEQKLYDNFSQLTKNHLSLFISHRLSSCKFCDKIIVLDKGHLIQIGSHEELIKDINNVYYKLWNAQAKYYT